MNPGQWGENDRNTSQVYPLLNRLYFCQYLSIEPLSHSYMSCFKFFVYSGPSACPAIAYSDGGRSRVIPSEAEGERARDRKKAFLLSVLRELE